MANIYDGVFRTILHDCRKLVIPVINEFFGETYTREEKIEFIPNEHFLDQQDAADQERITDTNFTVFGKTQKKYANVQKVVGDMMRGTLIETSARTILNQGINETKKDTALRMLKRGKLTIEEIAEYSGLSVAEVEKIAEAIRLSASEAEQLS